MGDTLIYDVAIVGGGVIGLCAAEAMMRRGLRVIVLDSAEPSHAGASYGNSGLIVPSHFEPLANPGTLRLGLSLMRDSSGPFGFQKDVRTARWMVQFGACALDRDVEHRGELLLDLLQKSVDLHEALALRLGIPENFVRCGLLMACEDEVTLDQERRMMRAAQSAGLECGEISAKSFGTDVNVAGGIRYDLDAKCSPERLMLALRGRLESLGCELRFCCGRAELLADASAVRVGNERIEASHFVVSAGAWTSDVIEPLGLSVPIVGGQGLHLEVDARPDGPETPMILVKSRIAVTPLGNRFRFGGTMELGVQEPRINMRRLARMRDSIARYLPAFSVPSLVGARTWAGLRPCSPDGMPIIGPLAKHPNVILATGHAMLGVSLGPITGEMVASQIMGQPSQLEHVELLSPSRWGV